MADSTQLTRALGNLVANANRYGDRSKAVEVRSEVEGGWARIQVVNEGPVISQELISKMFQPMERGSTDEGGGVGLGLYIVEQIARLHGGQATVSSSPRDGTCVSILFPANPQQAGGNA